ncbi:MAG TPA: glycoside hydrolase family 97 N-terminal domain-containing protein, partial [Chitinophagaceae bacterium]|nr:glycoside hydrolase family 97 N-terminal domain-containing protein [Chitinophagaceae bacterium]
MLYKKICLLLLLASVFQLQAQKNKSFTLSSPDGSIQIKLDVGPELQWSLTHQTQVIIAPSSISMSIQNGVMLGKNAQIISSKNESIHNS